MPPRIREWCAVSVVLFGAACDGGDSPDLAGPVVVAIAAQPCDRPTSDRGVGVVVAPDVVATAAHVVDGRRRAVTVDGRPAVVVAVDARTDLALLAADVPGRPATTTLDVPDHAAIRTLDGDRTVDVLRTGRLVVHDATDGVRHEREVHAFTPRVDRGTSGAPLVDDDGRVAGIVVLANRTDATAYAVTAAELRALIAGAAPSAAPPGCPD